MSAISEEAISCIRTVKAFSTESFETERYNKNNALAFNVGKKGAIYTSIWTFVSGLMFNGVFALDIWYGATLAEKGEITVGNITAFLLYMIQLVFNFAIVAIVIGNVFKMTGAS